ncbi:hypothetical protein [uncultured Dokdonia sp.]|uniref:hypothetical protein n=1 Tax=uncultured Dokdonia sp. TaxID=575653 RepID=UPI00260E2F50|nr:hypothetical protein [uncultured Dokdonia sp.]
MKFKRFLRLVALILMVAVAAAIPIPMKFAYKDNLPKNLQEQVDTKEEDDEEDEQEYIM